MRVSVGKKLFITVVALALLLFAFSCGRKAQEKVSVSSGDDISLLFEIDGCKVYRFYDLGEWVYFSNCAGSITYDYSIRHNNHTKRVQVKTINGGQ